MSFSPIAQDRARLHIPICALALSRTLEEKSCEIFGSYLFTVPNIIWFKNLKENVLGIWAIGGNDFHSQLKSILEREKIEHTIERIVVVTDHDDVDAEESRVQKLWDIVKEIL